MKNSKQYSQNIKKLFLELKRKGGKVKPVRYDDPIDALIYAAISATTTISVAKAIFKRVNAHFVDINDIRVSRPEEIAEVFGLAKSDVSEIAERMKRILQDIFLKCDVMTLVRLKEMGKRPAREFLEKLESVSSFIVDYVMLTALGGHAIPVTSKMADYLRDGEFVHPKAEQGQIESFLTRQITAANGYTFYALLRKVSESGRTAKAENVKNKLKSTAKSKNEGAKKKAAKKK